MDDGKKTHPPRHPGACPPDQSIRGACPNYRDDPGRVWERVLAKDVHPIKVFCLEALLRIEEPLSPKLLNAMLFDGKGNVGMVSYHVRALVDFGILGEVDKIPRRGAVETLYNLIV